MKVIERIAQSCNVIKTCNQEWQDKHDEILSDIESNYLPHGSGIDMGSKIDREASSLDKVVILLSYHHMDENGFYDGWTEHKVVVKPSFISDYVDITITGRNKNFIKEYLGDLYYYELLKEYKQ